MLTEINREDFRERYLLGRQVAHEGVRSFEARDTADRNVMVHLLGAVEGPEAVPWLAALSALTPERRSGLLGAFEIDGEAILVTESLPQVRSLADWFVTTAGDRKVTDQMPAVNDGGNTSVDPTINTAGSSTDLDLAGVSNPPTESPAQAGDPDPGQDAGEFTRMFVPHQPGPDSVPPDEETTEVIPRVDDPAHPGPEAAEIGQSPVKQTGKDHGEFTRMFGGEPEDAPAPPAEQPQEPQPAATSEGRVTPRKETDKHGSEFTEFFGAKEEADVAPQHSQTPIIQPSSAGPARQHEPPRRPDEKRKAGPRIVWRDQKSKKVPPVPEPPEIKVRRAKESPPGAMDAKASTQPEMRPSPPLSASPKAPGKEPPPMPGPVPSQPPGQFTEIFGHALSQDPEPRPPRTDGLATSDRKFEQPTMEERPPPDKGPRASVSDHDALLSGQASDDYLRALGSESQVVPPPAAPAPKPAGDQYDYSPDLPPPVPRPQPDPAPGPSDYTRVVSGHPAVPPPPAAAAQAPAPAPAPGPVSENGESAPAKVPTWLWVALVAIVLIMVLLIVVVVLT
jgi:hypothetical protein